MAKSKSGGTRSYLRGRVGADVYSVGRDAAGKKQQVVRSLAETVANPQTLAQMRGRMIMSTVMQAVSAMSPIIDHSFDGFPSGQPCISEFIKRNYALIKADVAAHPASGNAFALNEYQEKGIKNGAYVISSGKAVIPAPVTLRNGYITIHLSASAHTVGDLKAKMAVAGDFYYTLCIIGEDGKFYFARAKFNPSIADSTEITNENASSIFLSEGTGNLDVVFADNDFGMTCTYGSEHYNSYIMGVILSQDAGEGWIHSTTTLDVTAVTLDDPADDVLPTYPQGNAEFLNGGEL